LTKLDLNKLNEHERRLVRRVRAVDAGIAAATKSIEADIGQDDPAGAAALATDLGRLRRALMARFGTIVDGIFEK
jgi:hypothetical protein